MPKNVPDLSMGKKAIQAAGAEPSVSMSAAKIDWLFAQADAGRWGLSREQFASALNRCTRKRFASANPGLAEIETYLASLHLEDLALAVACLENCEAAWNHFVTGYRGYLRSAAAAVLRCRSASPEACDLADSLFAELYGLADGARGERSLFRYFHGRSSLKTWLRAVLAQRHVDVLRSSRRFQSLDDEESKDQAAMIHARVAHPSDDPHRQRYTALFVRVLQMAVAALEPRDHERFRLYYSRQLTLAEIGRQLGEHESSVSRNLDRIRLALRRTIEETLRNGCPAADGFAAELGLSEAQIALCFEYAAADTPFDLDKILERPRASGPAAQRPES